MIHLSNLELDEFCSLFFTQILTGFKFPRHNHQGVMLRKVLFNLIKENHGLHEDHVIAEYMIPTTFHEETEFLSDTNLNSLKHHYMTFYWKVREGFLDYIED
jgi:hypothetical protein